MRTAFIYLLRHPSGIQKGYVGRTVNPKIRFLAHLARCRKESNYSARWIRALLSQGLTPDLEILDEIPENEAGALEAAYIEFFREQGWALVNVSPGGEGFGSREQNPNFGKPRSQEVRAKISAAHMGKTQTIRARLNMSESRKGILKSHEHRLKIQASNLGKKHKNNTSGFAGICWHKASHKWAAQVTDQGKKHHVGVFSKIEDAIFGQALWLDAFFNTRNFTN